MRRLLITAAMLFAVSPALAQTTATGTGTANSSSSSGAVAIGGGGGSAQAGGGSASVVFNTPGSTNSTSRLRQSGSLRTVPNAIAPGLGSAGIETCYGPGVSGGASGVGFGLSFGMGQFDNDCNARLYSRTLFAMGYKQQAINLLVNESGMVQRAFGYGGQAAGVVYAPRAGVRAAPARLAAGGGCTKWSGGSPGAGVCVY